MTPPTENDLDPATAAIMVQEHAWHVDVYAKPPIALVRGEGSYVWDAAGRRYLDLYGGHCVAIVGHSPPRLVEAITAQAQRLLFYSNAVYSDVRSEACEKVARLAPEGMQRLFFCNSGTEAIEAALKIARKATGRMTVVSMNEGFHGRTLGALGATGMEKFRDPAWPVPTVHRYVPYGDLAALRAAVDDTVAAVMLEPIPSMGGVRVADDDYFVALRELCDATGALVIFDEIQTGFGRTGTLFFGEGVGIRPDLIAAAKGIAGGVPAGVVFVREDIAADIGHGQQGTTFGGGPLASVAMSTIADMILELDLPAHAAEMGTWLASVLSDVPGVHGVTGRGLLVGIDLDRPARPVVTALRDHGILCGGSSVPNQMRLLPPLTLTQEEAEPFAPALASVLETLPGDAS